MTTPKPANSNGGVEDVVVKARCEVREMLDRSLFVRASDLLANITAASKDKCGKIFWITLEKEYHSTLVKTVSALSRKLGLTYPIGLLKEALFDFLLPILNGEPQADFFNCNKVESKANRANRERKRLARKRTRAAARERKRECDKLKIKSDKAGNPSGQTRTCKTCSTKFTSRKRLSKHKCPGKREKAETEKKEVTTVASDAKRARRARARKAKKVRSTASKVVALETEVTSTKVPEEVIAAKKLDKDPPVTEGSGSVELAKDEKPGDKSKDPVECEDCDQPAVGYWGFNERNAYPKCRTCGNRAEDRGLTSFGDSDPDPGPRFFF